EEVELDEPRGLDVVLVVLRDHLAVGAGEARDVIPQRRLADDDARGVHAGVTREPLELRGLRAQLRELRVRLDERLELRLALDRFRNRVRLPGRLERDE